MKYLNIFALIILIGFTSACTNDFDELNTDPNEPSSVPTSFLLTSAQKSFMDYTSDEWWSGRRGNQLAQFWASNQYSSESRYQLRTSITNNYWDIFYTGTSTQSTAGGGIANLMQIIKQNQATPVPNSGNQIAVAMILRAWMMQQVTDCWGDVPFSQANLGTENPSPSYDSQSTIYPGLITMLDGALASIDNGQAGPAGDIIYGGDMDKWAKFGNSLKLRIGMRMADRLPDDAKIAVSEAVAAGVMTSNDDGAFFQYLSGSPNNNPINEDRKTRNDFAASNTMIDVLVDLGDPRISEYFALNTNDEWVGEVYGLTEADAALTPDSEISQRSAKVLAAEFPGIYMDYAQVCFLLAEAVERQFITGTAEDYYKAGITASMEWWGVDASFDVDGYIGTPGVAYDPASWKESIGKQKWIALYMQGIEAWTEWRRLDFGILNLPQAGALDGSGIPTRMKYPLSEYSVNKSSVDAAVGAQGADTQDTPVWWDVN